MRTREQHNRNKKPPCINPERQDHDSSVTLKATRRQKHSLEENTHTMQRPSCFPVLLLLGEADVGETEGNVMHEVLSSDSLEAIWEDLV